MKKLCQQNIQSKCMFIVGDPNLIFVIIPMLLRRILLKNIAYKHKVLNSFVRILIVIRETG